MCHSELSEESLLHTMRSFTAFRMTHKADSASPSTANYSVRNAPAHSLTMPPYSNYNEPVILPNILKKSALKDAFHVNINKQNV